jgi:hypothetical protein
MALRDFSAPWIWVRPSGWLIPMRSDEPAATGDLPGLVPGFSL